MSESINRELLAALESGLNDLVGFAMASAKWSGMNKRESREMVDSLASVQRLRTAIANAKSAEAGG